jgi:glutathione synthase/RimK-type ligase-like ATP-grasp enzyme
MRVTLLTIGDIMMDEERCSPSLLKFIRYSKKFTKKGIGFEYASYDDVLLGRLPCIPTKNIEVMLFFPFSHWNSRIERYDVDNRIYGDEDFGKDYKNFFLKVDRIIRRTYKNKKIRYINSPKNCILDRDKRKTASMLRRHRIPVPRIYNISNIGQLNRILEGVEGLYVKPPFGAMGKGISYVTKKGCWTNFIFRDGRIVSRPHDYDWRFVRVSKKKRNDFLKALIRKNFIFEEGIKAPRRRKRRFDIRIYVVKDETPYIYARSAPEDAFVTNWSQGGRIERKSFLKKVLTKEKIRQIEDIARKGAKAMDLNYAGVDILLDETKDKIYFSEAQSFPGYERRFNLMKFLAERI